MRGTRNAEEELASMKPEAWRRNFLTMTVLFSLGQGMSNLPSYYAVALLDDEVGRVGTGCLYLVTMLSSLLVSPFVVTACGAAKTLVLGISLDSAFLVFFAASVASPDAHHQWVLYVMGALLSGLGTSLLWTAQGKFFADTCDVMADLTVANTAEPTTRDLVRQRLGDDLSGANAAILLLCELGITLLASFLQGDFLHWAVFPAPLMGADIMFTAFAVFSVLLAVSMFSVAEPGDASSGEGDDSPGEDFWAAISLWSAPELWSLSLTNFTFGICGGYIFGVANANLVARNHTYSNASIGTLEAVQALVAALAAALFGKLAEVTGRGFLLATGSLAFGLIPLAMLLPLRPDSSNDFWGSGLVALYVLQGIGRSTFEGTNRAVYAEFFPGKESAGAFANCIMHTGMAYFISFQLQTILTMDGSSMDHFRPLEYLMLILAALIVPGYVFACAVVYLRSATPHEVTAVYGSTS